MAESDLFGQERGTERALEHRLDVDVMRVERFGVAPILIHHRSEQILVERAPVDADAHGFAIRDRDRNDRAEVVVAALAANVAGVDPILRERTRAVGIFCEEQMPVVVKVADDGDVDADVGQATHDFGDGRGSGLVVHGHAHEL